MTTKKKAAQPAAKVEIKMLPIKGLNLKRGDTDAQTHRNHAALLISPEVAAFQVLRSVDSKGALNALWDQLDEPSLVDELQAQAAAVNRGELAHVEAMLMNQATALQGIFGRLVERGMNNDHLPTFEGNMRMALRAQNQCRATLETLAAIKNPPVVFAKQANINHGSGNQQVNNGTSAPDSVNSPRTEEIKSEPNQLLEADHGSATLDTRATSSTGGKNPSMATLDA